MYRIMLVDDEENILNALRRVLASQQENTLRRLEEESPGITKVNWGPNGEVIFDDE